MGKRGASRSKITGFGILGVIFYTLVNRNFWAYYQKFYKCSSIKWKTFDKDPTSLEVSTLKLKNCQFLA